ncbi:MAG: crotonase/enoyl-CoA hydratase family protein [Alphaproteobacteria bacterium]
MSENPETTPTPPEGRITRERRGAVYLIGFDRAAKFNGFTPEMLDGLAAAYTEYESDDDLYCALVFAHGPNFTAGLDLPRCAHIFREGKPLFPSGSVDPFGLYEPIRTKPIVFAVQGICFTLGIELLLAGDIAVAASNTRFSQLEVKRGIMASAGATIRMTERAGWGNAMMCLLAGGEFDAETALRYGFIQEIVDPGQQFDRGLEIAETIAEQAPLAVREMIRSARKAVEEGPLAAAAELKERQKFLANTEDAAEGVRSFEEKRPAVFKGR